MEGIATGLAVDAGKTLVGRALKEIRDVWGFNDLIGKLEKELSKVQAFLTDLGDGKHAQIESRLVNNWLKDVKNVTCLAENLMDDYEYEMLRRKLEFKIIKNSSNSNNQSPRSSVSFKKKCCSYMKPATNPLVFRLRMTCRVKQILSEFDELYKDAGDMGLKQVDEATKSASTYKIEDTDLDQIRENPSTLDGFIGREKDQNILLQMLRNPTSGIKQAHHLPIIAIVGLGGLGKTTLARRLFDHKANEGPFDGQKVWICVSENFDVKMILKEMVESVTKTTCELKNTNTIIDTLEGKLNGKKLFLVLDDVWEEKKELWDSLKSQLQRIGVLVGSVILITTRSDDVAKAACSCDVHKLEGLSDKDGWKLLTWQFSFDPSLNGVATSILNQCKGVPLAILAIKRVLLSLKNQSDWKQIEESKVWDIKQNPTDKNYVMPSLLLSYNHFNQVLNLQQCFACCAIFPKDRVIRKGELIALWLAQDLLYDEHKSSSNDSLTTKAETIGEKYIDVLVNHSFLLKEKEATKVDLGWCETYKMHDLVHDLASYVSKTDLLVCKAEHLRDEVEDAGSHLRDEVEDADSHFRHLAFDLSENKTAPPETVTKQKLSKLRTISFWNGVPKWNTLICAKYMRTLIMAGIGLEEVPTIIGQLVHLRYLDLSSNKMAALPESICKLYQLQTLRLIGCYKLKELPRELHRLENIRHIETSHTLLAPKGVGQLTSLQTLPHLRLRDGEGWTMDELGPLGQAKGEMHIEGLENIENTNKAKTIGLKRKDKIVNLWLEWGHRDGEEEKEEISSEEYVLDCLEPHPDLQSLAILGFKGVRFPRWVRTMSVEPLQSGNPTQLNSLATVVLEDCKRCQQLPSLGQLPNLKVLHLVSFEAVECIGEEFYESNNNSSYTCSELPFIPTAGGTKRKVSFPNLIKLNILNFGKLTTWDPPSSSATAFPSLESLRIWECPNLRKIPTTLQECTSLQDLWIHNCPSIEGPDVPDISRLQHLTQLTLDKAGKLSTSSPQRIRHLCGLTELELTGLTEEWDITLISSLSCLKSLTLVDCPNFKPQNSSLDFLSSSKLQSLYIHEFDEMEALPEWIGNLRSLQTLWLWDCKKLKYLPSKQAMQGLKLQNLHIVGCPLLEET